MSRAPDNSPDNSDGPHDSSSPVDPARESSALTDKQMEARLGKPRGKLQMVVLADAIYHRVGDVWEPYPNSGE